VSKVKQTLKKKSMVPKPQCGNFMNFVSFRFYVKSILRILEVENQAFYHI